MLLYKAHRLHLHFQCIAGSSELCNEKTGKAKRVILFCQEEEEEEAEEEEGAQGCASQATDIVYSIQLAVRSAAIMG